MVIAVVLITFVTSDIAKGGDLKVSQGRELVPLKDLSVDLLAENAFKLSFGLM